MLNKEENTRLLLYTRFYSDPVFAEMIRIAEDKYDSLAARSDALYSCASQLIAWAEEYGFCGNLPGLYISWLLVNDKNVFSLAAEQCADLEGTLESVGINDLENLADIICHPWGGEICLFGARPFKMLEDYTPVVKKRPHDAETIAAIQRLGASLAVASTGSSMYQQVIAFYNKYGVGEFLLYRAFRWCQEAKSVVPIQHTEPILLSDIIGCEEQKNELCRNTEAFLSGAHANNVLLYGDSGTGKTSSIKAILNEYYAQGLRMIEVARNQYEGLPDMIHRLRDRKYSFILLFDDLSFEDFETEYKQLKGVIEGGLEMKPQNMLIYATSNRRHLIRESWKDRTLSEEDVHHSDTLEEKLSLVNRFGITLRYYHPTKDEYLEIISDLSHRYCPELPLEEVHREALKWESHHAGFTGRNARQFWDAFMAEKKIKGDL